MLRRLENFKNRIENIKKLVINSQNRQSGSSNNFTIAFNHTISAEMISLSDVIIPNTIYTISAAQQNNTIYFNDGSNHTAIIPDGYYSLTNLLTQIGSSMTTASGTYTYTASYTASTYRITISSTGSFSLTFGTNTSSSAAYTLGFSNTNTSSASSQTGTNAVNLITPMIYITIKQIGGAVTILPNGMSSTFVVPVTTTPTYSIFQPKNANFEQVYLFEGGQKWSFFDIQLFDVNGNALSLNGADWQLILEYC